MQIELEDFLINTSMVRMKSTSDIGRILDDGRFEFNSDVEPDISVLNLLRDQLQTFLLKKLDNGVLIQVEHLGMYMKFTDLDTICHYEMCFVPKSTINRKADEIVSGRLKQAGKSLRKIQKELDND
jgi:hypothetical protein